MLKKPVIAVLFLLLTIPVLSQVTENHIGFRSGMNSGVYYQSISGAGTAEVSFYALLTADQNSVRLTVMKIVYETSLSEIADNLFLTWGYGGHAGFAVTDYTYFLGRRYQFDRESFRPLAGIDGWGGLEYRFTGIPMAIGLNVKPYMEIMVPGFIRIQPGDVGLSVAYRF